VSGYEGFDNSYYGHPTCPSGCYPCGEQYYKSGRHGNGCCGHSICNEGAYRETQKWQEQQKAVKAGLGTWLMAEVVYKEELSRWLIAEDLYRVECQDWLFAERVWREQHDLACVKWLAAEKDFKATLKRQRAKRVSVPAEVNAPTTSATMHAMQKVHGA